MALEWFDGSTGPAAPAVLTTHYGTNADLLAAVVRLYPLDGLTVADVTYGKGGFWKKVDTSRFTLLGSDVAPPPAPCPAQILLFAAPVLPPRQADFTALPYEGASLDVVVLDPPYLPHPGARLTLNRTYRNANLAIITVTPVRK